MIPASSRAGRVGWRAATTIKKIFDGFRHLIFEDLLLLSVLSDIKLCVFAVWTLTQSKRTI